MLLDLTAVKSTLIQTMAWCRLAWANVDSYMYHHMTLPGRNELREVSEGYPIWQPSAVATEKV